MKETDLVLLRLPNDLSYKGRQPRYNTWFRVMFIDNDGTFIGKVEKVDMYFELYNTGEHIQLYTEDVLHIYKEGEQFCYGDGVSICECKGLCRNK